MEFKKLLMLDWYKHFLLRFYCSFTIVGILRVLSIAAVKLFHSWNAAGSVHNYSAAVPQLEYYTSCPYLLCICSIVGMLQVLSITHLQ